MRPSPLLGSLLTLFALFGCARALEPTGTDTRYKTFTGTAFTNSGDTFEWIVDVQASRIAERQEFLPLHVAFLNKSAERVMLTRESFVLETSDGTRLPAVPYSEFERNYPRHRVDLRVGRNFFESLNGRYPSPPYRKRPLEFYPLRESGDVPRDEIELSQGDLGYGFVYFRLPDDSVLDENGTCRLLLTLGGPDAGGEQYVLALQAYKPVKKQG